MTEIGRVKRIDGDRVLLQCKALTSCHACGNGSCNAKGRDLTAANSKAFKIEIGEYVEVYLPSSQAIFSGFLVFIFPLLLFFTTFLAMEKAFGFGQGTAMLAGLGGLVLGFFFSYLVARRYARLPEITRTVMPEELLRAAEPCGYDREEE